MSRLFTSICLVVNSLLVGSSAKAEQEPAKFEAASNSSAVATRQLGFGTYPKSIDVTLGANRTFHGTLVDRQGRPVTGARIELLSSQRTIATAKTDGQGGFRFSNLSPGEATLKAGWQMQKVRLWHARVAPPSARDQTLVVVGSTVRGQCVGDVCAGDGTCYGGAPAGHFGGFFQKILHNPWIVSAGTAAAIAIPLAVDNDDDDDAS